MVTFTNSKTKKFWLSFLILVFTLSVLTIAVILFIEERSFWAPLIGIFGLTIGIVNLLMVNRCYFSYDDQKMTFRSIFKTETVYFKDIDFFGTGKSSPISKTRIYYFLVKTKEKNYQPDIPVTQTNAELIKTDLADKIRKANPHVVIKF